MPRTKYQDSNIQLQINQIKDVPQILHGNKQDNDLKSISLKPGFEYVIELTPVGQVSASDFQDLSLQQRECRLSHEIMPNSIFKVYTKRNCEYECRTRMALEKCHCMPWDFLHFGNNAPECDLFGRTCFFHMIENMTNHDTKTFCPDCIEECDKIEYKRSIISSKSLELKKKGYNHCNDYLCYSLRHG